MKRLFRKWFLNCTKVFDPMIFLGRVLHKHYDLNNPLFVEETVIACDIFTSGIIREYICVTLKITVIKPSFY